MAARGAASEIRGRRPSMKAVLQELASPIRGWGYRGSGQNYRRVVGDIIFVINFQKSRWGDRFYVNLGGQPNVIPDEGERDPDPKTLKEYECVFRHRLPGDWNIAISTPETVSLTAALDAARHTFESKVMEECASSSRDGRVQELFDGRGYTGPQPRAAPDPCPPRLGGRACRRGTQASRGSDCRCRRGCPSSCSRAAADRQPARPLNEGSFRPSSSSWGRKSSKAPTGPRRLGMSGDALRAVPKGVARRAERLENELPLLPVGRDLGAVPVVGGGGARLVMRSASLTMATSGGCRRMRATLSYIAAGLPSAASLVSADTPAATRGPNSASIWPSGVVVSSPRRAAMPPSRRVAVAPRLGAKSGDHRRRPSRREGRRRRDCGRRHDEERGNRMLTRLGTVKGAVAFGWGVSSRPIARSVTLSPTRRGPAAAELGSSRRPVIAPEQRRPPQRAARTSITSRAVSGARAICGRRERRRARPRPACGRSARCTDAARTRHPKGSRHAPPKGRSGSRVHEQAGAACPAQCRAAPDYEGRRQDHRRREAPRARAGRPRARGTHSTRCRPSPKAPAARQDFHRIVGMLDAPLPEQLLVVGSLRRRDPRAKVEKR